MFDDIRGSLPALVGQLSARHQELFERLSSDYRRFLEVHNGGFVDEFRYTFFTGVPFKTAEVDNPSRTDCPVEFFGFHTTANADGRGSATGGTAIGQGGTGLARRRRPGEPADLLQTADRHRAEEFLPQDVIAIARCVQSSLVCISVRRDDPGAIYYWDWYWRYPWSKAFFDDRIVAARERFDDPDGIIADRNNPRYPELFDALNFATLVKLAPSFSEWYSACEDQRKAG